MIVTIDGPAGAGKSSAAQALAEQLGFKFLDTGAMYRAVTLAAIRKGLSWEDREGLAELAENLDIILEDGRTLVNGEDVSEAIRTSEITTAVRHAADNPQVRKTLVNLQRRAACGLNVVTEGRDQGTVAFPEADCKIYLTASSEERARRRQRELRERGEIMSYDTILERQNARDERDKNREVGRLLPAEDAHEISTDGLSPEEVIDHLKAIVRRCMA